MKNKKKLSKIIFGTLGIVAIACVIPACVVSCGSSNSSNSTPVSTNSTSSPATSPSTPDNGSTTLSAIVTPSTSGLKGIQYQTNEFGFGSSVTLNAKFNEPKLNLATGQKANISVKYSWFSNNSTSPIKDANTSSYVISMLTQDVTYQVNAAYTITITDGLKTVNTITNTVSDVIKLNVSNKDLQVNLSYGNNDTSTITDYGQLTFNTNIYAVFGTKPSDQLALTPSDFPSGYSLAYQELDVPSTKTANDVLPSAIAITNNASLSATLNVNQSYPIAVNLMQNKQVVTTSNPINVCGYIKTDGSIALNSTVPTAPSSQGLALGNNSFAFGSKVILTANFNAPQFALSANQSVDILDAIYTWTVNGKTITNSSNTYTINNLFANSTYSVAITYMYQIVNSQTKLPLSTPISGTLSYNKSVNLNVNYSNIKFALSASSLNKDNQITSFGYQALTTNLEVSFDHNKTYVKLSPSDFLNADYKIEFGTLTNGQFNVFAVNDVANTNAWNNSYVIENDTELQAQITIDSNNVIKSNVIATNITSPSVGLSASIANAKNAVGKQIASNEFAFGSQVTLTADFIHPGINSGTGISTTNNITYTWYKNGAVISGATNSTYTIPYFLSSDSYSVSVNWNWSINRNDANTIKISNLESANQTYQSNILSLTVNNSNMGINLSYGSNKDTSTITSNSTLNLNATVTASFGSNTINIPNDVITSNFGNWKIAYQRYAFNQWNTLSTNAVNSSGAFSYAYNPTGIYPIQAQLITANQTYTSNLIKVNTSYNGDVLGLDNIPTSLQSQYNYLSFIQNYINISLEGQGGNSAFMQQVNTGAIGYKLVQNTKPSADEQAVAVSPVDLSNFQVNWTNPNNKNDGVVVSATIANANGLSLMSLPNNNQTAYYGDAGSITLSQGDVIKWLLPFSPNSTQAFGGYTSTFAWSVNNGQASVNYQINSSLVLHPFTSFNQNGQNYWQPYNSQWTGYYGYYKTLPDMSNYYWGFTVESANGTNLLANALKTNSAYKNISNDTQWILYGNVTLLGTNENNPAISFNSNTSSYAQALYDLSIAGINNLK